MLVHFLFFLLFSIYFFFNTNKSLSSVSSRQVRLEGGKKQQPAGGLSVPVCVIGGEGVEVSHLTQSALNVRHVDLNVVLKTADIRRVY